MIVTKANAKPIVIFLTSITLTLSKTCIHHCLSLVNINSIVRRQVSDRNEEG